MPIKICLRSALGSQTNVSEGKTIPFVSHKAGKWYASIQTEYEVEQPRHSSVSMVGIDVGVAKLATLADGTVFEPVNSFRQTQRKLAKAQWAMSRKIKKSRNWRKAVTRVQGLHTIIANIRRDYLHKVSNAISKNHAMIVIEYLRVSNMSKSVKGNSENLGRNVRAKSGLNRSILDQGWYELRRQLEYKQCWHGGDIVAIPPQNTSRRCSACGYIANAELNAAQNILAAGHAVLACGEKMKQEPAEASQTAV